MVDHTLKYDSFQQAFKILKVFERLTRDLLGHEVFWPDEDQGPRQAASRHGQFAACRERLEARAGVEAVASPWSFGPVGKPAWAADPLFLPSPLVDVACQGERKPVVTLLGRGSNAHPLNFDLTLFVPSQITRPIWTPRRTGLWFPRHKDGFP